MKNKLKNNFDEQFNNIENDILIGFFEKQIGLNIIEFIKAIVNNNNNQRTSI